MCGKRLVALLLALGLGASLGIAAEALASGKNSSKASGQSQMLRKQGSQLGNQQYDSGNMKKQQQGGKAGKSEQQERSRNKIRHRLQDGEIYGRAMMSEEERSRYRERLDAAQSDREWTQLRAEHQLEMQRRATSDGKQLAAPVYGEHMMTINERKRYEDRLNRANSKAQRNEIREQHQILIQERARALGVNPPAVSN